MPNIVHGSTLWLAYDLRKLLQTEKSGIKSCSLNWALFVPHKYRKICHLYLQAKFLPPISSLHEAQTVILGCLTAYKRTLTKNSLVQLLTTVWHRTFGCPIRTLYSTSYKLVLRVRCPFTMSVLVNSAEIRIRLPKIMPVNPALHISKIKIAKPVYWLSPAEPLHPLNYHWEACLHGETLVGNLLWQL